jgi:hypothetical protein
MNDIAHEMNDIAHEMNDIAHEMNDMANIIDDMGPSLHNTHFAPPAPIDLLSQELAM